MLGSLGEVLPHAARRFGDGRALVAGDRSFSFRQLDELSNALAISLTKLGVVPGDRVTLYAPNSWEWLVSYYGVLKRAPSSTRSTSCYARRGRLCDRATAAPRADRQPGQSRAAIAGGVRRLRQIIVFGADALAGALPFAELISRRASFDPVPVAPERSPRSATRRARPAPKGAMQSHRAVILNARDDRQMHVRTPPTRSSPRCRCPHVYGNVVINGTFLPAARSCSSSASTPPTPCARSSAPGHDVRGRADDVPVHAGASRPRALRPLLADPLHGRRPDDAGRQDASEVEARFGCRSSSSGA